MADYQQALEDVDAIDSPSDYLTDMIVSVYSGTEVEDGGGYDDLVARRGAPEDRELLKAVGWAEAATELREEELPLTENGAAIHYYYHEVGKKSGESESLLNDHPEEFARQAFEWWYRGDGDETER